MSQRGEAILWPNLGEEEGETAAVRAPPAARATAHAWRLAFPDSVRLHGEELARGPWGAMEHAAWSWLDRWLDGHAAVLGDRVGVPWLPTRRVVDEMRREGWASAGADPDVVEALGDKAWAHARVMDLGLLPNELAGLVTTWSADELRARGAGDAILARVAAMPDWTDGRATLKPRRGTSGRGRVALVAGEAPPSAAALERLARRGGALLEPWLPRASGLSTQWWLSEACDAPHVTLLGALAQLASPAGIPRGSAGVVREDGAVGADLTDGDAGLESEAIVGGRAIAEAARAAGLRGPCGVDSLIFEGPRAGRGEARRRVLRPVLELNPRFTAGFVALALARRAGLGAGAPGRFRHVLLAEGVDAAARVRTDQSGSPAREVVALPGGGRLEIERASTMRR